MSGRKKDFSPQLPDRDARPCAVEGCPELGQYKAPQNSKQLGEYIYLCLEHVREHNQKWDYFGNMEREEIEDFMKEAITGHRPTWTRESAIRNGEAKLYAALDDFLNLSRNRASQVNPSLPAKLRKALATMDMQHPYTEAELKRQYRALVKKFHPDVNKGSKEFEEKFKQITTAYTYLTEQLKPAGFTLLELSIVLVIIGLVIGGVLVGKELIDSAALRAQVSQFEQLDSAANAFKLKYNCIPGDCANAESFITFPSGAGQNGNGDGMVANPAGTVYPFSVTGESLAFMSSLNLSGLYPLAPLWSFYTEPGVIGKTIMAAKLGTGGIIATYMGPTGHVKSGNGYFLGMNSRPADTGNQWILTYARPDDNAPGYAPEYLNSGVLTPLQAYSLDQKIDDGMPKAGKVFAVILNGGTAMYQDGGHDGTENTDLLGFMTFGCVVGSTATYDLTRADKACSMLISGGF